MAKVDRINPLAYFSQTQWQALTHRSSWRGLWLVTHAWFVIGACMVLAARWPWLAVPLIPVVACRQLGLLILMHDAAHALLHPNRKVNDWVAYWLCSSALFEYRPYHLQHHRFAMQAEDPDLGLAKPFPTTRQSLWRKFLRDVCGLSFLKLRFGISPVKTPATTQLLGKGAHAAHTGQALEGFAKPSAGLRDGYGLMHKAVALGRFLKLHQRFFFLSACFAAAFFYAGYGWLWAVLWLVPLICWFPVIYRLRNIAEHAMLQLNEPSALKQARTTQANWLERVVLAPYWVNYHCEHHMFTQIPCWNLPKAHRLLAQRGVLPHMSTSPGYLNVLRTVTTA
jgi:fatty acid desaturase